MKNKFENYITYGILFLVIGLLVFSVTGLPKIRNNVGTKGKIAANTINELTFKTISTGDTNPGEVSIDLTPSDVNNGQLKVKISVNTHSVNLEPFDLKEITTLEYKGKSIKPISAPALAGHHTNGELVFEVDEKIDSFTIKIKGIPKVEERIFKWP